MKKIWDIIKLSLSWIYATFHLMMIRISIALFNAEVETLKADPNALNEKGKNNQKVRIRNPLHRKMDQGQRDEQYKKDYYEVLKKADKFMKNATSEQMEMSATKWGMSIGKTDAELNNVGRKPKEKPKKDKWGRRYDHFGFYDPKNKNYGKTMGEVIVGEIQERITTDENNAIETMFSNKPSTIGLINNDIIVEDEKLGYRELNLLEKARKTKFPMTVQRDNDECYNRIEQLTEYLHIRRLDDEHKILEFLIPAKFGVFKNDVDGEKFQEIIGVDTVWIKDEYDNRYGYKINGYHKKTEILDESIPEDEDQVIYHVIKLKGKVIKKLR